MSPGSRKLFWKPWPLPFSTVVSPFPHKVNNWTLFTLSLLEKTYLSRQRLDSANQCVSLQFRMFVITFTGVKRRFYPIPVSAP